MAASHERVDNDYTRVGTALHKCMELWLCGADLDAFLHVEIEGVQITEEHERKIHAAAAALRNFNDNATWTGEKRVVFPFIEGAFGTVDAIGTAKDGSLAVVDFKFGEGVQVQAAQNAQLLFYAAGMLNVYRGATFTLVVIQPNDRGLPVLREWQCDRATVIDFALALRWAVANGHRDELLQSGAHCRFCPVHPVCPRVREDQLRLLTWNEDPHPNASPQQIADGLDLAEKAERAISALRQLAHDKAEHGVQLPGWKLVPKRASVQWVGDDTTVAARLIELGLADPFTHTLMSPAQARKCVMLPDGLTVSQSSGTKLVRADDPRPALPAAAPLQRLADSIRRQYSE
jgi:hypothetical protein